jgi:hypothetical protein
MVGQIAAINPQHATDTNGNHDQAGGNPAENRPNKGQYESDHEKPAFVILSRYRCTNAPGQKASAALRHHVFASTLTFVG